MDPNPALTRRRARSGVRWAPLQAADAGPATGCGRRVGRGKVHSANCCVTDCGNAQNCEKVCPKGIPLTRAIAELGRQTTVTFVKDLLRR